VVELAIFMSVTMVECSEHNRIFYTFQF
jgi:hypothetical protein